MEVRLVPAATATAAAGYAGGVEDRVLWKAAGYPVSAVLKFGMTKGLPGLLGNSPNASDERENKTEKYINKLH